MSFQQAADDALGYASCGFALGITALTWRGARSAEGEIYLPFEGDLTLAVILSKAFLLAEDKKIKDSTINRQIDAR